jgi:hypothetical protein
LNWLVLIQARDGQHAAGVPQQILLRTAGRNQALPFGAAAQALAAESVFLQPGGSGEAAA